MDALDLSNFTSHFTTDHVRQWKEDGVGLAIIQLISGVKLTGDDCGTQIQTCLDGGLAVDCYLFPGNDGLPLSTEQRLMLIPPMLRDKVRQLWIDVEPASRNPTRNAVDKALAACDQWAPWQTTGTYSAHWVASKMGWLPWPWSWRKQWLVSVLNSGLPNFGGAFSGTNNQVLTQYKMDVTLAGVSGMDRSILFPGEAESIRSISTVSNYNVGPGVAQAMADHGDEPRSDEVFVNNTEGSKISQTYGRDNVWYWLQEDNAVKALPFR